MAWVLLDVALAVLALALLAVVSLGLWRRVKDLGRAVGTLSDQLAQVGQPAGGAPLSRPTPAGHPEHARRSARGVRSSRPT